MSSETRGGIPFLVGSTLIDGINTDYIAFIDNGKPNQVIEHYQLENRGEGWTVYEYTGSGLRAYQAWSRVLSDNGAPSDGWYEQSFDIAFDGEKIIHARKTLNGRPTEPDEHELRAAFSSGQRLFERLSAE
ncbi:hypothetical protein [Hyphococcus sp. DH-69]|uniref:hypothetical protein n=1 Tax=Hyphococcus formosus TaxID=3143534 RepID=UPI00398B888C